ncbi:MAG: hypothetical protein ACXW1D_00560 [Halobacteriota archaeon]
MNTINLNDYVTVVLTQQGAYLYNQYFRNLNINKELSVGDELRIQIWDLANIFGERLYNGCIPPFKSMNLKYEGVSQ